MNSKKGRAANILALQDFLGKTMCGYGQHGATNLLGTQDLIGKHPPKHRQQWLTEGIEYAIRSRLGAHSVQGFDDAGTEHICRREDIQ